MGKGRASFDLIKMMRDARSYISEQLNKQPLFYPFSAAQTALDTMQRIIDRQQQPTKFTIERSDIGLLTAKSIELIDPQNCVILHRLSFTFLTQYWPSFIYFPTISDVNIAIDFYKQEGFDDINIPSHLRGINFNKRVVILAHPPKKQLQQWRIMTSLQGVYSDPARTPIPELLEH